MLERLTYKKWILLTLIMSLMFLIGCSNDRGGEEVYQGNSILNLKIDIPDKEATTQDIIKKLTNDNFKVIVVNQDNPDDRIIYEDIISGGDYRTCQIEGLTKGATYDVTFLIREKVSEGVYYINYKGEDTVTINQDIVTAQISLDLADVNYLQVNIISDLNYASGRVKLLNTDYQGEISEGYALIDGPIPANDYSLKIELFDSSGAPILQKYGDISLYPGRLTVTEPIDLSTDSDYLGDIPVLWEVTP